MELSESHLEDRWWGPFKDWLALLVLFLPPLASILRIMH